MRNATARSVIEDEQKFPCGLKHGYPIFARKIKKRRQALLDEWAATRKGRDLEANDILAAYDSIPPKIFSEAYVIPDEAFDTHLGNVQLKYLNRFKNIRRSWSRLIRYMPELMNSNHREHVLEMSTAHGATLEILRHFGHSVVGNDFTNEGLRVNKVATSPYRSLNEKVLKKGANQQDWPYRPIVESLGLEVRLFDAGQVPYPLQSKEFDVTLCFDALEHYCHPKDWLSVVKEFVRISRKTVLVEINPVRRDRVADKDYMTAVKTFVHDMLSFDHDGFRCVNSTPSFNQPRCFKLMCLAQ